MIIRNLRKFVRSSLPFLFWIMVWGALSLFIDREVLLPSPVAVIKKTSELFLQADFHISLWLTLLRVVLGYIIGVAVGAVLAVISFYAKPIETLLSPLFTTIRATPVASFIILALVWLGRGTIPTFTAFLMVLPIVYGNTLSGMRSADKNLYEVAQIYKFSGSKKLKLLYLPSALPSFLTGAKTSLGLAWKSGVAAEVLCALKYSIGGEIYNSKLYLETTELFSWTICVIVLSLILETIINLSTSSVYKKYTACEVADNGHSN